MICIADSLTSGRANSDDVSLPSARTDLSKEVDPPTPRLRRDKWLIRLRVKLPPLLPPTLKLPPTCLRRDKPACRESSDVSHVRIYGVPSKTA